MKKIDFKQISMNILDSWKESKMNNSYTFIQSKKIGDSFFTLSLYHINEPTKDVNDVYQRTLDKYAKLNKFKLISEETSHQGSIHIKNRQLSFYDKKRKSIIHIREKMIELDGAVYVLSGQVHECPLMNIYAKIQESLFNSITIKPLVS